MILNRLDKSLILSLVCGDQLQIDNDAEAPASDKPATELETSYLSGGSIHEVMDVLKRMGIDVSTIITTINDLWHSENCDAAYLLLVLCYIVSEVDLPEIALPPLSNADAVEAMIYNACLDMDEYLEDLEMEETASENNDAGK